MSDNILKVIKRIQEEEVNLYPIQEQRKPKTSRPLINSTAIKALVIILTICLGILAGNVVAKASNNLKTNTAPVKHSIQEIIVKVTDSEFLNIGEKYEKHKENR